jgi:thiamine kinase-like enzyme
MPHVITNANEITVEWLNRVLRREGVLSQDSIIGLHFHIEDTFTAQVMPLTLTYSDDAPQDAPRHLFFKLGTRKPEVDFYNLILPASQNLPVIPCYDAVFDMESGKSHLLMLDVSRTHASPPDALPLPEATCRQLMDILAYFHAQWWEHPRLKGDLAQTLDDVQGFIQSQAIRNSARFFDLIRDRLAPQRRAWIQRLLELLPYGEWQQRISTNRQVTLVHGDTHWWNFMFPTQPEQEKIYLVDWAVWHLDLPTWDIAYMLTQLCSPERRSRIELPLMQYYHERMLSQGVRNYAWEDCWRDYRLSVVHLAVWPLFWQQMAPNEIWWRALENIMSAFEDLNCAEFLYKPDVK